MMWRLAFLIALAAAYPAAAQPRAVSLDYCSDQYLLKLADPAQIAAVSRGADKDYSYMREAAAPYRRIRPSIEEVAPLEPEIVLRQWGGGASAERTFSRFGATVVTLGYPEDFDGVKANVRLIADALDQQKKGEALIAEIDRRLGALEQAKTPAPVKALYATPGGVTAGAHTMIDAILTAAGVVNLAAEAGQSYWPALPAEALILDPPGLIVAGFFDAADERINYWSASRHPALRRLFEATPTISLSPDIVSCAAWFSLDAAEAIAAGASQQ
ncbi:ABC transporter substrate-binding protein [Hyphococcus sp.]|uniref:ABC transporter substrate-binding protein n=1 Tax=Hyphococcus sp. TaxID=2038636 RepID=UPI003D119598